ncbi:MAG: GTPase [Eudoraea sp.]|nr:GTPase [Eudoraea sp.]
MNENKLQKLLFIYNANSGLRNMFLDGAHKILSPKTYECNLCDITFGAFTENKQWKKFRRGSKMEMEFLHKDEFKTQYASKFGYSFDFPIVLGVSSNGIEVVVSPEELNALRKAEELIQLINKRC